MKRGYMVKLGMVLLIAGLLATSTGCNRLLVGTNIGSIITGVVLGNVWTANTTESLCYRNGELIDCAELAAALAE